MAKYSYEFKKKLVLKYINGMGGYVSLCRKHSISDDKSIRQWVSAYKEFGDYGLRRSREKKHYSFEFKLSVVELYLTTEVSYQEWKISLGF